MAHCSFSAASHAASSRAAQGGRRAALEQGRERRGGGEGRWTSVAVAREEAGPRSLPSGTHRGADRGVRTAAARL